MTLLSAPAPELEGAGGFVNAPPLTLSALRGKIVLLDFWTFCCINCLHVLDELRPLERRYADVLVTVGVHSPKFPHEADHGALAQAVARYDVDHPVLDDPEMATRRRYGVRAWPTLVLIDPEGMVRLEVSGEGRSVQIAAAVEELVAEHEAKGTLVRGPLPTRAAPTTAPEAAPVGMGLRFPGKAVVEPARDLLAVADTGHHRIVLARGDGRVLDVVGRGTAGAEDGSFEAAAFRDPQGLCFWRDSLWVADTGNHLLRRVDLEARRVETAAGPLRSPWDVAPFGGVLTIAMAGTHQLWAYDPDARGIGVVAGNRREGLVDAPAPDAELAQPSGLAPLGNVLGFVDSETSSLRALLQVEGRWTVLTLVGRGLFEWGAEDGPGPVARLQHPLGLAAVPGGWLVADTYNHRLRRFDGRTGTLTTLAGSTRGFADGVGPAARMDEPGGVVVHDGAALVCDTNNHALRRVDLETGEVSTFPLVGLSPPGLAPLVLEQAPLAAESVVDLLVALDGPAGSVLDRSGGSPVRVEVRAEPAELLPDGPVRVAADVLPAAVAVVAGRAGAGTLTVHVRAVFCDADAGEGAACRLAERTYVVPVEVEAGGLTRLGVEPAV